MKTYTLKICSGVVIDGKIHRRGDEVEGVSEKLALQLLRRGKAEPATIYDEPPVEAADDAQADKINEVATDEAHAAEAGPKMVDIQDHVAKTPRGRGRKAEG